MVSLTIRNIPHAILSQIRILAAKSRRSMNSEILLIIEDGLTARKKVHDHEQGSLGVPFEIRDRLLTGICGRWKDTRSLGAIIKNARFLRTGSVE